MTYKRTITKFNRGVVDEQFMARDDVERVVDTCADMKNLLPIRLGPTWYRPGLQWLEYAWSTIDEGRRLIPFLVANNRSVLLEFAHRPEQPSLQDLMTIWVDGANLQRGSTADTITNGAFTTDATGWTDGSDAGCTAVWDAANGGSVKITGDGAGGYGRLSQDLTVTIGEKRMIRIDVTGPQVEVLLGTSGVDSNEIVSGVFKRGHHCLTFTPEATPVTLTVRSDKKYAVFVDEVAYTSAGSFNLYDDWMPAPDASVINSIRVAQSADVMFMVTNGYEVAGEAHPLIMVERRGDESWSITFPEFQDGPFGLINATKLTLTPSAVDGDITLTASLPLFASDRWVGRSYKLVHGADEGICVITGVTDNVTASARVVKPFGATTATDAWYPGRFSYYQPGPTAVALFDSRLWLGGDGTIDASVSDAYLSFDSSIEGDSKAISKTIGFGPVQQVYWMSAGEELLAGTGSAELKIGSNDFGDTITQSNCRILPISHIGSAPIEPVRIDNMIYFVQRAGKRILELRETGYGAERTLPRDIQLLNPGVCGSGIVRLALTRNPEIRLWIVNNEGTSAVCLLDAAESVNGWSTIEVSDCKLLDIAVIPDNEEDEVYFFTGRGAEFEPSIERMAKSTEAIGGVISRHYDGHILLESPGESSDLFWHLHDQEVYAWVNGKEHGPYTVDADGVVTFPPNAWETAVVGVRHHGHYLSSRLSHYIPQSVLHDRKRVTNIGVTLRDVVMKTVTYGDGNYCGYPLPLAEGPPSEDPNIIVTISITPGPSPSIVTTGTEIVVLKGRRAFCAVDFAPDGDHTVYDWVAVSGDPGVLTLQATNEDLYRAWFCLGVNSEGKLFSRGYSGFAISGLLGQGDSLERSEWTQIGAQTYWTDKFASNPSVSLAVNNSGVLYMWGANPLKLGGTTALLYSPRQVGSGYCDVMAAGSYCYGLRTNGTLRSWGPDSNWTGRPGVASSAVQVGSDSDWMIIKCGQVVSVFAGIKLNGTLWTWGPNNAVAGGSKDVGLLGQGDTVTRSSPAQVGSATDWKDIFPGNFTMFATRGTGTLWVTGGYGVSAAHGVTGLGVGVNGGVSSFTQVGTESDWLQVLEYTQIWGPGLLAYPGYAVYGLRGTPGNATLWGWGGNAPNSPVQIGSKADYVSLGKWPTITAPTYSGDAQLVALG